MSDVLDDLLGPDLAAFIAGAVAEAEASLERECDDCERRFVPKMAWGRFCSSRCRLRSWRKAQRAA